MTRKFFSVATFSGSILPSSLLLLALAIPILQKQIAGLSQPGDELRALKVERLRLARALDVLTENTDWVSAIDAERLTDNELTLSLIESIKRFVQEHQLDLVALSVNGSDGSIIVDAGSTTRVSISANISVAADLLSLFDAVQSAADWRPIEVRACTIARRDGIELNRLHASCTIDVYRFLSKV